MPPRVRFKANVSLYLTEERLQKHVVGRDCNSTLSMSLIESFVTRYKICLFLLFSPSINVGDGGRRRCGAAAAYEPY